MRLHETGSPFENAVKYQQDFIKWWKAHSTIAGQDNDETLLTKINVTSENDKMFINCGWKLIIEDHTISRLPFNFGTCSQFRLAAKKLATLDGAPRVCNMFTLEHTSGGMMGDATNNGLDSIAHGPEQAEHLSFELARPLKSLQTNLKQPIESLWVHAPSIVSFEGLKVHCNELTLNLPFQKSLTGIHKQLSNVDTIAIVLNPAFDGGLLSLAMVRGLKRITRSTNQAMGNAPPYEKAFTAINAGLTQGWNVHELQEKMIDAGLGKFARL